MGARQENGYKRCGWRGITAADTTASWFVRAYIVVALAAVAADAFKVIDLGGLLTWPVVIPVGVGLPLALFLLTRARRCPDCGGRELEIVPTKDNAG